MSERIYGIPRGRVIGSSAPLEQARFALLVHHDDAGRELAYTAGAERVLETAAANRWTVVSIKNDWATVFA